MAYYIQKDEPVGNAVKRMALEQIEQAASPEADIHDTIHDIRKRCKKLRALLRLVRDDLGKEKYKELNVFYRDQARQLAALRDTHNNINTLLKLRENYYRVFAVDTLNPVIDKMREIETELVEEKLAGKGVLKEVVENIRGSKKEVSDWPVTAGTAFESIQPGIKRVYKRGYKAYPEAYREETTAQFHEFRKRVKYLWYHTRLLKMIWPGMMIIRGREMHILSNLLGDDHDLMVLRKSTSEYCHEKTEGITLLNKLIERESRSLRLRAYKLAHLLYLEKPKRFVKRVGGYWRIGF